MAKDNKQPMSNFAYSALVIILLCIVLIGCVQQHSSDENVLTVAVSIAPHKYIVNRIAGNTVQVIVLIPPGANPATYEPSQKQIQRLEHTALYITVGVPSFPFEHTWRNTIVSHNKSMMIVDTSRGIQLLPDDSHTWTSPRAMKMQALHILNALITLNPDYTELYEKNFTQLQTDIDTLHHTISNRLSTVSKKQFIVFHPAWGYFAHDYGLQQIAIEHEHKSPGFAYMEEITALIQSEHISALFVQPQFDTRHAHTIADSAGIPVIMTHPLAENWIESLDTFSKNLAEALQSHE